MAGRIPRGDQIKDLPENARRTTEKAAEGNTQPNLFGVLVADARSRRALTVVNEAGFASLDQADWMLNGSRDVPEMWVAPREIRNYGPSSLYYA